MAGRYNAATVVILASLFATWLLPLASIGGGQVRSEPSFAVPDLRGVDYMAVGPAEFGPVVGPLLAWKEVRGMSSEFVPLEAVLSDASFEGRDLQETIRNFLVHARNESMDQKRSE